MPIIRADDMQQCIEECESCRNVCLQAMMHCLRLGGSHAAASHITLLLDCIDICATTATFMRRDSEMHRQTCEVCAEICDACAISCAAFPGDPEMRLCEAECIRCAQLCREMAR